MNIYNKFAIRPIKKKDQLNREKLIMQVVQLLNYRIEEIH